MSRKGKNTRKNSATRQILPINAKGSTSRRLGARRVRCPIGVGIRQPAVVRAIGPTTDKRQVCARVRVSDGVDSIEGRRLGLWSTVTESDGDLI